jgi:hypothetical protein
VCSQEICLSLCGEQVTIAFPDEGAWKRFYRQLQHFPMVCMSLNIMCLENVTYILFTLKILP